MWSVEEQTLYPMRYIERSRKLSVSLKNREVTKEWRKNMSDSLKGKPSWNKGRKMSEESKRKMSEAKKGKTLSVEHRQKLSEAQKGRIVTEETRKKISLVHKGKVVSIETRIKMSEGKRGKYKGEKNFWYGKEKSLEHRKKLSESKKGKYAGENCYWFGKNLSEETKKKLSLAHKGKKLSEETRRKMSLIRKGRKKETPFTEEHKQNIRIARSKQIVPYKDTKPERMMQIALALNSIEFKKHKLIRNGRFFHQVDLFIQPNLCIEVDGDYWHRRPEIMERDNEINHELGKLGYSVLRIWESDIKNNTQQCAEKIIGAIQKIKHGEVMIEGC